MRGTRQILPFGARGTILWAKCIWSDRFANAQLSQVRVQREMVFLLEILHWGRLFSRAFRQLRSSTLWRRLPLYIQKSISKSKTDVTTSAFPLVEIVATKGLKSQIAMQTLLMRCGLPLNALSLMICLQWITTEAPTGTLQCIFVPDKQDHRFCYIKA